jgi:hypothetical protein
MILAVEWVDENKDWLVPMVIAIGTVTTAWNIATAAVNAFKAAAGIAAIAGVSTAVGAGTVGVLGAAGAGAAVGGYMQGQTAGQTADIYQGETSYEEGGLFGGAFGYGARSSKQNVTININKGNVTAQEIAEAIRKANRVTGTNVLP